MGIPVDDFKGLVFVTNVRLLPYFHTQNKYSETGTLYSKTNEVKSFVT